jgi:hypothetical protein
MASDRERIQAAIAALSAQRGAMGDDVVDTALAPLLAQLVAMAPAPQSRRQVTILFLDVVGSTSVSQHLDPEDIHELMDGALERCTAIVAAHGGKVLQYAGDNLLAVFGIGQAREDDAEHAVQAGLALLEEGRRLGASVLAQHGHAGFDVRVGRRRVVRMPPGPCGDRFAARPRHTAQGARRGHAACGCAQGRPADSVPCEPPAASRDRGGMGIGAGRELS